jgi:hypothetical protein
MNGAIVANDAVVPRFARQQLAHISVVIFAVHSAADGNDLADEAGHAKRHGAA